MQAVVYVGQRLKALRIEAALTQAELAEKAGVAVNTVAELERDELAHLLDRTIATFMRRLKTMDKSAARAMPVPTMPYSARLITCSRTGNSRSDRPRWSTMPAT